MNLGQDPIKRTMGSKGKFGSSLILSSAPGGRQLTAQTTIRKVTLHSLAEEQADLIYDLSEVARESGHNQEQKIASVPRVADHTLVVGGGSLHSLK